MKEQVIYNVTVKVDSGIAESWLKWLKAEHIPDVLGTGCFFDARIVQLLELDDAEGPTYAIQYSAPTMEDYQRYISNFANEMRQKSMDKWGDRFIAFRSVMRVI